MNAAVVLMLLVVGMAAVEAGTMKKRFLLDDISNAQEYSNAEAEFDKVANGLDFDATVNALIPYIHSDMTVAACVFACTGSAASFLGPAAALAPFVCPPLCDGALAKLEEVAGQQAG